MKDKLISAWNAVKSFFVSYWKVILIIGAFLSALWVYKRFSKEADIYEQQAKAVEKEKNQTSDEAKQARARAETAKRQAKDAVKSIQALKKEAQETGHEKVADLISKWPE